MTAQSVTDMGTPIGEILKAAGRDGILLEPSGEARFAVIPLDDDLIDFLIERSPKFLEQCRRIREQMRAGRFHSHEEVKKMFGAPRAKPRKR